ncbi:hypothetical protein [uncultured Sphingomonas sp.]|uniref:hypothetical protein n=1 Tax=uncultured Sphingomonas sp. TaxID=158754 RepID=UPI0025CCC9C8|nr:hypothetical protein [uncultured Sphingomonas sp.]
MHIEDPAFTVTMDDRYIIHVRAHGPWSPEIADRYWLAFQPFLDESRRRLGYAKALIDRRGAPVMSMAMVQAMRDGIMAHYRPDDRLALVVDSSPLKSQVRKNYPLAHLDAFLSYDAALAWLQNH